MFYKIDSFGPIAHLTLSRWSFQIEIEAEMARKLRGATMVPGGASRLNDEAAALHAEMWKDAYGETRDHGPVRDVLRFAKDTCLLTNINFEPGNACGLDIDWDDLRDLDHKDRPDITLRYLPHNVDSMVQASGLLAAFLVWANRAAHLLKLPKAGEAV